MRWFGVRRRIPRALEPWAALEARLSMALSDPDSHGTIDLQAAVRRVARAKPLHPLTRHARGGWPSSLILWVDERGPLAGLVVDRWEVAAKVVSRMGWSRVQVCPMDPLSVSASDPGEPLPGRPGPGDTVLALTELGVADLAGVSSRAWLGLGRRVRAVGARAIALCPVGAAGLPRDLLGAWRPVAWGPGTARADRVERVRRARRLLRLASRAALIQPGLLRDLRSLLRPDEADVLTELDAAALPEVRQVAPDRLRLTSKGRRDLQAAFDREDVALHTQVQACIADWRAGEPTELFATEILSWEDALGPQPDAGRWDAAWARAVLAPVAGLLEAQGESATGLDRAGWLEFGRRVGRSFGQDSKASVETQAVVSPLVAWSRRPGDPIPAITAAEDLDRAGGAVPEGRWLRIRLRGDALMLEDGVRPFDPAVAPRRRGSPLGRVQAAWLRTTSGKRADVDGAPGETLPLRPGRWATVRTDLAELRFRAIEKPPWATAIGRDRFGLWADWDIHGVVQKMRWIPPGRFMMGSRKGEVGRWEDEPHHEVTLTHGYWLGDTPVTQALWKTVVRAHKLDLNPSPSSFKGPARPVEQVSWDDVQPWLQAISTDARLPTEAEWEYACRAGIARATWRGELENEQRAPLLDSIAWYVDNSDNQTQPVAQTAPNPWGLFDMLGNVYEWCIDGVESLDELADAPATDPWVDPALAASRVVRGGAWGDPARCCRAAYRVGSSASSQAGYLGFRVARGSESARPTQVFLRPKARDQSQRLWPGAPHDVHQLLVAALGHAELHRTRIVSSLHLVTAAFDVCQVGAFHGLERLRDAIDARRVPRQAWRVEPEWSAMRPRLSPRLARWRTILGANVTTDGLVERLAAQTRSPVLVRYGNANPWSELTVMANAAYWSWFDRPTQPGRPVLEVLGGPEDGKLLAVKSGQVVGRYSPDRTVAHPLYTDCGGHDALLSRRHLHVHRWSSWSTPDGESVGTIELVGRAQGRRFSAVGAHPGTLHRGVPVHLRAGDILLLTEDTWLRVWLESDAPRHRPEQQED